MLEWLLGGGAIAVILCIFLAAIDPATPTWEFAVMGMASGFLSSALWPRR